MHQVLFDHARTARIGLPEAVLCEGKSLEMVRELLERFSADGRDPVLFTRLAPEVFFSFPGDLRERINYHQLSRTAFTRTFPSRDKGRVAVVSAGTADGAVAWEAARTLEYLGISHALYEDSGVAGLWRLAGRLDEINAALAIIVVAGLDAALASVLGGLTPKPIFAVPTSVGYGAACGGRTALAGMLVSCAPGVAVFNIDNGYGAACAAARVVNLLPGM
ncbi:MAG: nickel pincer cofactor biosynthesis protein LarB [Desulfovibrio sp.]|jgi:NCAIR mutase (PurE)-related protein|nr:nickel pincer cofactor biosynthesis protein LarB [Desulfovibrio sp.]